MMTAPGCSGFSQPWPQEVLSDLNKEGAGVAITTSIYLKLDPNGDPEKASNRISGIWTDREK